MIEKESMGDALDVDVEEFERKVKESEEDLTR